MNRTKPYEELHRNVIGYMLNSPLSPDNQKVIKEVQQEFESEFGDVIWSIPQVSLHVTLMDWVAPLVDYGEDKDALFQKVFSEYDKALQKVLSQLGDITIVFDSLQVSEGAIYIQGTDAGQLQAIRESFLNEIDLLEGTKRPPTIIHTSIARFMDATGITPIQEFAAKRSVHFTQKVGQFILVRETEIPMLQKEIIKTYKLGCPC